jgi:hypothetical protein
MMREPALPDNSDMAIALPCNRAEFADFLLGIIGKTNKRGRRFSIVYSLDFDNIKHLCHVVEQRVVAQHEAAIADFEFRADYTDGSFVSL